MWGSYCGTYKLQAEQKHKFFRRRSETLHYKITKTCFWPTAVSQHSSESLELFKTARVCFDRFEIKKKLKTAKKKEKEEKKKKQEEEQEKRKLSQVQDTQVVSLVLSELCLRKSALSPG